MQTREEQYVLTGIVEMDEAYFGGQGEQPKAGRGTNKTPVLVAMALTPQGKPKHLKMKAVLSVKSETIKRFVVNSLDSNVTIVGFWPTTVTISSGSGSTDSYPLPFLRKP